jgi:hypothetical protein
MQTLGSVIREVGPENIMLIAPVYRHEMGDYENEQEWSLDLRRLGDYGHSPEENFKYWFVTDFEYDSYNTYEEWYASDLEDALRNRSDLYRLKNLKTNTSSLIESEGR